MIDSVIEAIRQRMNQVTGILGSIRNKREAFMRSRPEVRITHRRGRNGNGIVKTAVCRCGRRYVVRDGWPNDQCGRHVSMRKAPK